MVQACRLHCCCSQTSLLRQRSSLSVDGGSVRGGGESGGVSPLSDEDAGFCSRFDLPTSEVPFPDWKGGRRCTLIDRDRPLMGSRGGRLYLTYSFLCFERLSIRSRDSDRLVLPLSDITEIEKVHFTVAVPEVCFLSRETLFMLLKITH